MKLAEQLLQQIADSKLVGDELVRLRCRIAGRLIEAGEDDAARRALGELWSRTDERASLERFDQLTRAEVLLQVGVLVGRAGRDRRVEGSQETARNLIGESAAIFGAAGEEERAAEALTEMARCYCRQGAFDRARQTLKDALARLAGRNGETRARALLLSAVVETSTTRFSDALGLFAEAAPLFAESPSEVLKGKFHREFGRLFQSMCAAENGADCVERALAEFSAASSHFERAGTPRYAARAEHNLGLLLLKAARFREAHEHLKRARRLSFTLEDRRETARVDETRARVLLAEGRNVEAEKLARAVAQISEQGGEPSPLADALTTHGTALARLGWYRQAQSALKRAIEVAERAGEAERAGRAALASIEELDDRLSLNELRSLCVRAGRLLGRSRDVGLLRRLNACAVWVLRMELERSVASGKSERRFGREGELQRRGLEPGAAGTGSAGGTGIAGVGGSAGAGGAGGASGAGGRGQEESETWGGYSWDDFSLWDAVERYEARLIERALREADGSVTKAARLLGFRHHNSLIALLNTRHQDLLHARTPPVPRKRSVVQESQARQEQPEQEQQPSELEQEQQQSEQDTAQDAAQDAGGGVERERRRVQILCVEDDAALAGVLQERLEAAGWGVEVCGEGEAALKLLESESAYDVLLIERDLADASGLELVQAARALAHRRRTPIIMLSARDCVMEAHRAGVNLFLRKPEDVPSLVESIARLLDASGGAH